MVHLHFASGWTGTKGYLMEMVQQELKSSYRMTDSKLDNGGLKIYTTINQTLMDGLASAVAPEQAADGRRRRAAARLTRTSAPCWCSPAPGPSWPSTAAPAGCRTRSDAIA